MVILNLIKKYGFLIFLLFITMPFIYMALYNTPQTDDITIRYLLDQEENFLLYFVKMYRNWNSFYTSNALIALYSYSLPNNYFSIGLSIIIIVSTFFTPFFILLKQKIDKDKSLLIAGLLLLLVLSYYKNIGNTLFWITGVLVYQLGFLLSLVSFWSLVNFKINFKWRLLWIITIVIGCGTNSATWYFLTTITLLVLFHNFITKRMTIKKYWYTVIITLVPSAFILLSPGNKLRSIEEWSFRGIDISNESLSEIITRIKTAIFNSFDYSIFHFIPEWIFNSPLIPVIIILLALVSRKDGMTISKYEIVIFFLYILFSIPALLFMSFFSMSAYPPERTINIIYIYFVLVVLFFIYLVLSFFKVQLSSNCTAIKYLGVILLLLYILHKPNNIRDAYSDLLSGKFRAVNKQIQHRKNISIGNPSLYFTLPVIDNTKLKIYNDFVPEDSLQKISYIHYIELINK